jgi:eukaryotic-like serine/threonine-protein kinase
VLLVTSVLAWTGIHDVYRFTESSSFLLRSVLASMHAQNVGPLLTISHGLMVAGTCLFASRFRDEIERARQENVLAAWHLARLLPAEIGSLPAVTVPADDIGEDSVARILDTAIDAGSGRNVTMVETTRIADSDAAAAESQDPLAVVGPRYVPSPTEGLWRDQLIQRDVVMRRPSSVDEAVVLARIDHPGVPPVYDFGHDERGPWMSVKPVTGTRLSDASRAEREQGRHRMLAAFAQVCLTLDFAHASGVVHGSLDASRIVLGDFGEVYVVDWGVRAGGSAPEVAGGKDPTTRSDVFALGAILFELLAGEPLVSGDRREIVLGRYDARPSARGAKDVPAELDEIVVKATAYDPVERHQSARELHDAVESFLGADRDVALRRKLAADHLARAERCDLAKDREGALREIGRALALAPEREQAVAMLTRLVTTAPERLPEDVVREIERQRLEATARPARIAGLGWAALWLVAFPMFALVVGVRDWSAVVFVFVTWALTVIGLLLQRRAPLLSLVGFVAVAASSLLFGAYFVVPAAAVTMALGHVLGAPARMRRLVPVFALLALVVPGILGDARILDLGGFYGTPEMPVVIVRSALVLWQHSLFGALSFAAIATLLVGVAYAATYRSVLEDMEATNRARVLALSRLIAPV